jgi:hypothetical protein
MSNRGTLPCPEIEGWIVIIGDPVGGFTFTGPFASYEAAEQWAGGHQDSWTAFLEPPNPREHDQ